MENALVNDGQLIFWDENSGPSLASNSDIGTIPSESFTVLGTSSTTASGTTPEPSSIMLFGSGILGLAGVLRRKLFQELRAFPLGFVVDPKAGAMGLRL